jgi:hypothetical protein
MLIGPLGGARGEANASPVFFSLIVVFLATESKRGKQNIDTFSKRLCGVKREEKLQQANLPRLLSLTLS